MKTRRLLLGGLSALTALSIVVPLVLMLRAARPSPPSEADANAEHLSRGGLRDSKLKGARSSSLPSTIGGEGRKQLETGEAERGAGSVSCGNHRALSCADCGDEGRCGGDCEWKAESNAGFGLPEEEGFEGGGACRPTAAAVAAEDRESRASGSWLRFRPLGATAGPLVTECREVEGRKFFLHEFRAAELCKRGGPLLRAVQALPYRARQMMGPELFLYQQLEDHPWRTRDPEDASLFVVPPLMSLGMYVGTCHVSMEELVQEMHRELLASPYYQRNQGRDHLLAVLDWRVCSWLMSGGNELRVDPATLPHLNYIWKDKNPIKGDKLPSIFGEFRHASRNFIMAVKFKMFTGMSHGKIRHQMTSMRENVTVPHLSPGVLDSCTSHRGRINCPNGYSGEASFEEYLARRKYTMIFIGHGYRDEVSGNRKELRRQGKLIRPRVVEELGAIRPPNILMDTNPRKDEQRRTCSFKANITTNCNIQHLPPDVVEQKIEQSRFSLHVRGSDASSSRVFQALASGTPQLFLAGRYYADVAHFKCRVQWDRAFHFIDDDAFLEDPSGSMSTLLDRLMGDPSSAEWRQLWAAQRAAADDLLWHTPGSRVAHNTIEDALRLIEAEERQGADANAEHLSRGGLRDPKLKGARPSSLPSTIGGEGRKQIETGKAERGAGSVSCGNHRAPTCAECGDEEYCNGDCEWEGGSADYNGNKDAESGDSNEEANLVGGACHPKQGSLISKEKKKGKSGNNNKEGKVDCGNHRAPTCAECGDEKYCNGDCKWEGASADLDSNEDDDEGGGTCQSKSAKKTKNTPIVAAGSQAAPEKKPKIDYGTGRQPPSLLGSDNADDLYLQKFIVVPEHSLLFCYVDKVGCTMFNSLFRALRIVDDGGAGTMTPGQRTFQANDRWYRNSPPRHNVSKRDLEHMLVDPKWTKAVFFRDPATRFLSMYRSKCELREDGGSHCRKLFGGLPPSLSFGQVIDMVKKSPQIIQKDTHTSPMSRFCGGLNQTLQHYDYVRQLTEQSSPGDVGDLLDIVGVSNRTKMELVECIVERKNCTSLRSRLPHSFVLHPKNKKHNTGSNREETMAKYFKTDDDLKVIQELYKEDYNLFGYRKLSIAGIQEAQVR